MRIGIDPGLDGAIVFLADDFRLILVVDMPVMTIRMKRRQVNAAELAKTIKLAYDPIWPVEIGQVTVYLEQVSAMPGQGVSGMFSFGMSYGVVHGVVGTLQIPLVLVAPAVWKKRAGLLGKDKDLARTVAQQLYPEASLGRKKDIGRADAILIARFGEVRK